MPRLIKTVFDTSEVNDVVAWLFKRGRKHRVIKGRVKGKTYYKIFDMGEQKSRGKK